MTRQKCIDAYGNERKEGHITVTGHASCARCGTPRVTNRTTPKEN